MPSLTDDVIRVLRSAYRAMWTPSVLLFSTAATVLTDVAIHALGAERGFWTVPAPEMAGLAVVVAIQFWMGVSVIVTALDHMRHDYLAGPPRLVNPVTALEAGLVSIALTVAILGGLLLFVVPGVLLALRWSQATPLILDHDDTWRTAAHGSEMLTIGKRSLILLVWLAAGAIVIGAGWLASTVGEMAASLDLTAAPRLFDLAGRVVTDAFSLSLIAALYNDLHMQA